MDSLDKDGTIQNRLVRVYGRVQGVGFREACVRRAQALGITGWVRNRVDGSVEVMLQGSPEQLADILIDLLVKLHPQARAVTALLDSRTDWTQIRLRFSAQALAGVRAALMANAPGLAEAEADDIAAVVLNNMKTMVGMTRKDAPTTPGAPDQLRLMNRLYLGAKLTPARP